MKALITGSAGFVGRHMTVELMRRGWQVVRSDIVWGWDAFDLFAADRTRYDLVVHAAARSPHRAAIDGDPGMHPYNTMLDAAMFDWAIRTRQRRVLYFSSCAALDGPVDDYARTKLNGEWLAEKARAVDIPVTIVRPYSGYGEDQSGNFPFRALVERARRREEPFTIWGDGQQVRDWIHVSDVVNGALAVVESGTSEPVSLCTGVGTSMLEVAKLACATVGYDPEFEFRLDKPAGVAYRVGDPIVLDSLYMPQVSIEQGIKLALEVAGD